MGESCVEAHSSGELEEWGRRWEERERVEEQQEASYSDRILAEVLEAAGDRWVQDRPDVGHSTAQ